MALPNKRRWLLIVIWIVVLVNILYFVFMRMNIKNRLVQKYGVGYLEKITGGKVIIGDFSFNEKFVMIEGFRLILPSSSLEFYAESIHIEYNLMQLLWRRVKNQPFLENIFVNKPYLRYFIDPRPDKNRPPKTKTNDPPLPEFRKLFRKLNLYEGEVEFVLDVDEFMIDERFHHLSGEMQTENGVSALITGNTDNGGVMQTQLDLSGGWFNSLSARVEDYIPYDMYITEIDSLKALYDIKFTYLPEMMTLDAGLKDIYLEVAGRTIVADSLDLIGDSNEIDFRFDDPVADGNAVQVAGKLLNTFSSIIGVDADFSGENVSLLPYQNILKGKGNFQGQMTGRFTDFKIEVDAQSDSLELAGQNIRQADVSAVISNNEVEFSLNKLVWEKNNFEGIGFYGYDNTIFSQVTADSIGYSISDISINGKLAAEYSNKPNEPSQLTLSDVTLHSPWLDIDKLELMVNYEHPRIRFALHRLHNDISLTGEFDLETESYVAKLELRRFQLGKSFDIFTFPNCTGRIIFQGDRDSLLADSNLRFYDQHFGNFDGRIITIANLDFKNNHSNLELHTGKAKYNYHNLQIDLKAEGNLDSISTTYFNLNDQVDLEASFFLKPEPAYKFQLSSQDLDIKDIMRYLVDYRSLEDYNGKLTMDLQADSRGQGDFKGIIDANEMQYRETQKLSLDLNLQGDNQKITIEQGRIFSQKKDLGFVLGYLTFFPELEIDLNADLPSFDLSRIFPESEVIGTGRGNLGYNYSSQGASFDLEMEGEKFNYGGIWIHNVEVDISQKDRLLVIRNLHLKEGRANFLKASGSIGFNILNSRSYPSSERLNLEFSGDLLRILQNNISYIKEGKSQSKLNLNLAMGENGFEIYDSKIDIKGTKLLLKDQKQTFKNINIEMSIADNVLTVQNFNIDMGTGKLLMENSVGYNDQDLYIHMINTGQILLYTSKEGVEFHLPQYTAPNTSTHLLIRGRDSHYLRMFNDQGEAKLLGDLVFSSTDITYPPDTSNIMNWVDSFTADIRESWSTKKKQKKVLPQVDDDLDDYTGLPFNFDLHVFVNNNVRYVTYPFEINFEPDSYLYLNYQDDKFSIKDAFFSSKEGNIELVGTEMDVQDILITFNTQVNEISLKAEFERKVADGTLIQLTITDEREGVFPNNLLMTFSSDNTDDQTDTEKLFRLRYGRGLDDITDTERQSLFQDDLIQTAGGEIENIIIDPVINQFELYVTRLLNIDYFQMETSFIYNLLSSNSDLYGNSEDQDKKYSADALLENLSLKAGKYILDDLFLNYNVTFQKVYDTDLDVGMGVYHTFSFRYDMPMNIKFIYEYQIEPYDLDSHEYSFTKTIKFNQMQDLYFKIFYPYTWQNKIKDRY